MEGFAAGHEGEWMYVSLAGNTQLANGVRDACLRCGWPVLEGSAQPGERRLHALALADACILHISKNSRDVGVELAFAASEQRPIIALRSSCEEPAPLVEHIIRGHSAIRELSCDDVDRCVAALETLLGDPAWQEEVARATPGD